jgi:hypothetical protein
MLLELPPQEVVVSRLTSEPIAVLCQHHGNIPGGQEVPHTVHAWPLKACAALSRVGDLLENLVTLSGSVVSQSFDLLS